MTAGHGVTEPARRRRARGPNARLRAQLAVMVTAFVGCTVLGAWWAAPSRDILARTARDLAELGPINLLVVVAIGLAAIAAEMLRLYTFGRVIGVRVGARAAFDAAVANNLFSWISPGGLAGDPAAVYAMHRRGVPLDGALAISFAKFATSVALYYGVSGVLLFAGYGPPIASWAIFSIALTIALAVVLCGSFVAGAIWPARVRRWITGLESWLLRRWLLRRPLAIRVVTGAGGVARRSLDRLAVFRAAGWSGWLAILASHLLYYSAYVGLLVTLAWMLDARSIAAIVPIAIIYQGFTYIAPVPGIPEASAAVFFGSQLPDVDALIVVLVFRALTAYLQVAFGLIYLPAIGAMRAILDKR
jgi:uncharacterized membrane protein YbhN (UPF0104 family)